MDIGKFRNRVWEIAHTKYSGFFDANSGREEAAVQSCLEKILDTEQKLIIEFYVDFVDLDRLQYNANKVEYCITLGFPLWSNNDAPHEARAALDDWIRRDREERIMNID